MGEQAAKLRATLAELEAELEEMDELDDESRALLRHAHDEIEERLSGGGDSDQPMERLREALAVFEARYPKLTHALNQMAETLAEMGF